MWLVYVYVGETAFVWIESAIHQKRLNKKLKEEGYVYTDNKYHSMADIFLALGGLAIHSIPFFNLAFPISHINFHRAYDEYKNYLLDVGSIEEPNTLRKMESNTKDDKDIIDIYKTIDKAFGLDNKNKIFYQPQNQDVLEDNKKGYSYKKILK